MGFWQITPPTSHVVVGRAELKALVPAAYPYVYLMEGQRSGWFEWKSGDFSAQVALDTREGKFVKVTAVAATDGCYVRQYDGRPNVQWWDTTTGADLAALQACTDVCGSAWVPNGTYNTTGPWLLDDNARIVFESRAATITSTSSSAIIRARGHTTTRNFDIQIEGGLLVGSGKAGPVAIDLVSASKVKVVGTRIRLAAIGVRQGGSGSKGAFYNEFIGVDMEEVGDAYENGTLANSNKVFGGRTVDCFRGSTDYDNSDNAYFGWKCEHFTNSAHRVSHDNSASQRIGFYNSRMENSGPLAGTGTGILVHSAAQGTVIVGEFYTGLNAGVSDAGTGTDHVAAY